MTIYFATDHAGFDLKNILRTYVESELGFEVVDCGAFELDALDDFPDYVVLAARAVAQHPEEHRAIILGGSGQGEAMCANRFRGVRAAVYYGGQPEIVTLSREHNAANVLALGARFLGDVEAKEAVRQWLTIEPLPDEKYTRRNTKLDTLTS